MAVGGQRHAPAALLPRKTRYPLYTGVGGPQCRSGQVRKISPPNGIARSEHCKGKIVKFAPRTGHSRPRKGIEV